MNVPEITVSEVNAMREKGDPFTLLDIREQWENDLVAIDGSHFVAMEEVTVSYTHLTLPTTPYV